MTSLTESRFVLALDHDFNKGRNEGGFHEVVLTSLVERNVHTGDVVDVVDDGGDFRVRGRVRCLIAVVEEIDEP